MRAYRAAHPEKTRAMRKAWNLKRKDEDSAWKRADRVANPEKHWARQLRNHGMHPEQWSAMWDAQNGNCWLCDRPLPEDRTKAVIDHDHAHCPKGKSCRYCRRGLAHSNCNTAIGLLGEDPAILRIIADKLEWMKTLTTAAYLDAPQQDDLFGDDEAVGL